MVQVAWHACGIQSRDSTARGREEAIPVAAIGREASRSLITTGPPAPANRESAVGRPRAVQT